MVRREDFIHRALDAARRARREGALIVPEIAAAQAALESAYGRSRLARQANNLFGIKAGWSWRGEVLELPTREFDPEQGWLETVARWRKYPDWAACFADYGAIIARLPWFADAADAARRNDARGFLRGLLARPGEPGWATDPDYEDKVLAIAEAWGLLDSADAPHRLDAKRFFLDGLELPLEAASLVGDKLYVRTRRRGQK